MKKDVIDLIRERRKYEYLTLDGRKPSDHLMYYILSKEIELEMKKIGARNKTALRKEAKGNKFLTERLRRGEFNLLK